VIRGNNQVLVEESMRLELVRIGEVRLLEFFGLGLKEGDAGIQGT
jgi:hypothetical protein